MKIRRRISPNSGFSLMENLVSISVLATFLPMMIIALGAARVAKEKTSLEFGSVQVAEYIFSELPTAWIEGGGELFAGAFIFPELSNEEELSFLVSSTGEAAQISSPDLPQTGSLEVTTAFIATVKRESSGSKIGSEMFNVRVEAPAGRPVIARQSFEFNRRFHAR